MTRRLVRMPSRGYWPPHEWPKPPYHIPEWMRQELEGLIPDPADAPPCKLMLVSFEQLQILEINLSGFISSWQQRLLVTDVDGTSAQVVSVPIPQDGSAPFEMPLNYGRYVRTRPTDIADILAAVKYGIGFYNSFRVGTGGTVETHLLRSGTSELPPAQNVHGGPEGWKMGANVLKASDAFCTYQVAYNVSCSRVFTTELPYIRGMKFISRAMASGSKTTVREPRPELIRLALARLGYEITDDYGEGEERTLLIEGPGRIEDIEKAFGGKK